MELPAVSMPVGAMAEPNLESLSARFRAGDAKALPALARQFESVFLSQLLKNMRQTLDSDSGGLFANDPGDVQGGLFDMMMGRHLADAGGIGLANVLMRELKAPATGQDKP